MGEVFEAFQSPLRRSVALKTIRWDTWVSTPEGDLGQDALRREFVREALVAARLEHPNIAPVHDLAYIGPDRRPHLAMKLIRGESWSRLIQSDFPILPPADFLARHLPILERMALAVAFAHSRGIIHRDLKPSQVMVGDFGETVLMDWGLALQFREATEESPWPRDSHDVPTLASASNPAGTPAMMAPEQTRRTTDGLGPHTDVYLLGGTLYYLLTGYLPHGGTTTKAALLNASTGIVVPPQERAPDRAIPEELAALAMVAMRPEPADRVPSAEAFIAALRDYLSGASRRRESEAFLAEATALAESADLSSGAYARQAAIADRVGRALELWSDNRAAFDLKARNLADRVRTEIAAGDLQLAAMHHGELAALLRDTQHDIPLAELERELREATARRARQHRQRAIFAWAATLLLLGHGIGMTIYSIQSRRAALNLEAQKREIALRGDREALTLTMRLGRELLESGKNVEAIPLFARALVLAQVLEGTGAEEAVEAARLLEEASRRATSLPPAPSD